MMLASIVDVLYVEINRVKTTVKEIDLNITNLYIIQIIVSSRQEQQQWGQAPTPRSDVANENCTTTLIANLTLIVKSYSSLP